MQAGAPAAHHILHPLSRRGVKLLLWHDLQREVLAYGESAALRPPFA